MTSEESGNNNNNNASKTPSATRVNESTVLNVSIDTVWAAVRGLKFPWASDVASVEVQADCESAVGGSRSVCYKDGTQQSVQIMELSDLQHFVTYCVTTSEPSVSYTSATHQLRLRDVTLTPEAVKAQTFVEWTSDFSNDAGIAVMEDSRYKKRTAFKDMAVFFTK